MVVGSIQSVSCPRTELAFCGVQELGSRFHGTPHLSQVQLLHLRLLLDNHHIDKAKELIEDIITG